MKLEDLEKAGQATDYKGIIARYLFNFANEDEHFKQILLETDKTLEGCIRYIESEAKKVAVNSCAVVEDNVVYQQARHYFLEDSINNEVKSQPKATPKATPQEVDENDDESDDAEEIENKEIDLNKQEEASNVDYEQEVKGETKSRKTKEKAAKPAQSEQPSLFDFEF